MRRSTHIMLWFVAAFVMLALVHPLSGQPAEGAAADDLFAYSVGILQPDKSVLYSVFVVTDKAALNNVTIKAAAPANAIGMNTVIAPERAVLGSEDTANLTLTWQIDALDASTVLGPFTYRVTLPESVTEIPAGTTGTVAWSSPTAGSVDIHPVAESLTTFEDSAAITLDAKGTTNDKGEPAGVQIGQTGIWLYAPPDTVAGTVTLRFTKLTIDDNNVPQQAADTWWCALIRLETDTPLTLSQPLTLLIPTRQALTPGMKVQVLAQTGNGLWDTLPTAQGLAISNDGTLAGVMITGDLPNLLALGVQKKDRQEAASPVSATGGGFNSGFNSNAGGGFNGGFNGGFGGNFNGGFNSGFNNPAPPCGFNFCH
ncbi:MAG: hypothetical protein KF716_23245 [Anaerolineae bacterium]|nr:hypothetical protein [Anaerolineae bacterium]